MYKEAGLKDLGGKVVKGVKKGTRLGLFGLGTGAIGYKMGQNSMQQQPMQVQQPTEQLASQYLDELYMEKTASIIMPSGVRLSHIPKASRKEYKDYKSYRRSLDRQGKKKLKREAERVKDNIYSTRKGYKRDKLRADLLSVSALTPALVAEIKKAPKPVRVGLGALNVATTGNAILPRIKNKRATKFSKVEAMRNMKSNEKKASLVLDVMYKEALGDI